MTGNDIRALLTREPFQPFRMHMVTGKTFDVPHPDFVWVPPRAQVGIHVIDRDDILHVINAKLVERVAFTDANPRTNGTSNGS